jgi:hypothetical protein
MRELTNMDIIVLAVRKVRWVLKDITFGRYQRPSVWTMTRTVKTIKIGRVTAVIRKHLREGEGELVTRYSVQIRHPAQGKKTGARHKNNIRPDDLPAVALVIQHAHEYLKTCTNENSGGGMPTNNNEGVREMGYSTTVAVNLRIKPEKRAEFQQTLDALKDDQKARDNWFCWYDGIVVGADGRVMVVNSYRKWSEETLFYDFIKDVVEQGTIDVIGEAFGAYWRVSFDGQGHYTRRRQYVKGIVKAVLDKLVA